MKAPWLAVNDIGNEQTRGPATRGRFARWELVGSKDGESHILTHLGSTTVKFILEIYQPLRMCHHGIALYNQDRQLMWGHATDNLELAVGEHEFCYTFPMLPLRPGPYSWLVSLYDEKDLVDAWDCIPEMVIATEPVGHRRDEWAGVLNIPGNFSVLSKVERSA